MATKSRSKSDNIASGSADVEGAQNVSPEASSAEPQDARIEELERRIAELDARLANEPPAPAGAPVDAVLLQQQTDRIAELQRLVANLAERVAAGQAVAARDEQFKAATRSVEAAAAAVQKSLAPSIEYGETSHGSRDCGCEPCDCVSCACCTFEVWMTHVRVDQMQNPLDIADANLLPTSMLEIWMFASIDPLHNIGRCIPDPSPTSYIPLHKQITDPFGQWVSVNCCIGSVSVRKGVPLTVPLSLTAVERENALERVKPANRDEWGSGTQDLTLDCCCATYPPILISVALTSWGQAGGAITGRFLVRKSC